MDSKKNNDFQKGYVTIFSKDKSWAEKKGKSVWYCSIENHLYKTFNFISLGITLKKSGDIFVNPYIILPPIQKKSDFEPINKNRLFVTPPKNSIYTDLFL